jgi:hypothetical protein
MFRTEKDDEVNITYTKNKVREFSIPLNKDSAVVDLKRKVAELGGLAPPGEGTRMIIGNFKSSWGTLSKRY